MDLSDWSWWKSIEIRVGVNYEFVWLLIELLSALELHSDLCHFYQMHFGIKQLIEEWLEFCECIFDDFLQGKPYLSCLGTLPIDEGFSEIPSLRFRDASGIKILPCCSSKTKKTLIVIIKLIISLKNIIKLFN